MLRRFSMKATVDANVIFSFLIKNAVTRRLLFNPSLELFAPEFIVNEFLAHLMEVRGKSGLPISDFLYLIEQVFAQITLVKDEDIKPFLPAAAALIADPKDWLYIACALLKDTIIWSNDGDFKTQTRVRVVTTSELIAEIGQL